MTNPALPAPDRISWAPEVFQNHDLSTCLLHGISGRFQSRAARQILGHLAAANPEDIPLLVAKELLQLPSDDGHGVNSVTDIPATGALSPSITIRSTGELWSIIRQINVASGPETATLPRVFGRLLQIRSLSPIVALQLLTCLQGHFDLDFLFSVLISNGQSTARIPDHSMPGHPSHWSFPIKYYYLSPRKPEVYQGQVSGPFHDKRGGIHICRGTALVALSLGTSHLPPNAPLDGRVVPWKVLAISCNRTFNDGSTADLKTGATTFLSRILHEIIWTRRNLRTVSNEIASIATPSDDFLFDKTLRESLLFEDQSYSNSQTYFWALQALRAVNDCITTLISTWEVTSELFKETLPRVSYETSGVAALDVDADVVQYLNEITGQTRQLQDIITVNNGKQDEIRSLRDGLFNASTVLEARTTVSQGRNIQLLTYISILFLPASFVTSIFGMDGILPESMSLGHFAIIFGVICGLTYAVIIVLGLKNTSGSGQFQSNAGVGGGTGGGGTSTGMGRFSWFRRAVAEELK